MTESQIPSMVNFLLDEAIAELEDPRPDREIAITHLADAVLKALCPPGTPVPIDLARKIRRIIDLGGGLRDWKPAA